MHPSIQVSPFLVEAGAHVVDGGLEAGVEDGVVEGVGRGGEQGAQQAQRVTHTDVAERNCQIQYHFKSWTVFSYFSPSLSQCPTYLQVRYDLLTDIRMTDL